MQVEKKSTNPEVVEQVLQMKSSQFLKLAIMPEHNTAWVLKSSNLNRGLNLLQSLSYIHHMGISQMQSSISRHRV